MGVRAAASEHPLEPSAETTGGRGHRACPWAGRRSRALGGRGLRVGGRGIGHVPVGGARTLCRWAGRRPRARGRGVGSVHLNRHQGGKGLVSSTRLRGRWQWPGPLWNPRCTVCALWSLREPCHSRAGSRTRRRLERPQNHLELACFPLTHCGPRPWTASDLRGVLSGARPRGRGRSQGWKKASVCGRWTRPTLGGRRPCRAICLSPDSPVLQRSTNGQCRPAVKSVTRAASGL